MRFSILIQMSRDAHFPLKQLKIPSQAATGNVRLKKMAEASKMMQNYMRTHPSKASELRIEVNTPAQHLTTLQL